MKYAVISDIHANKEALEAVLADAAAQGADEIVCLGDVVGYGPLPEETARLVRSSCKHTIAGNHDDAVSGRLDPADFIGLAADAAKRHRQAVSSAVLSWLSSLPYTFENGLFAATHGDFTAPREFRYIESVDEARVNFAAVDGQLLFAGHTHVPGIFLTGRSGAVYSLPPQDFTLEDGKRYIVNPGSVGYPRQSGGTCYSSYVVYDSEERTVVFRLLPFSVSSVMQRGAFISRHGRWFFPLAALCAGACVFSAAALWRGRGAAPEVRMVEAGPEPVRSVTVELHPSDKVLNRMLELSAGSPPARLQIEFLDPAGRVVCTEIDMVKQARRTPLKIPEKAKGAVQAKATLWAVDGTPDVAEFSLSGTPARK